MREYTVPLRWRGNAQVEAMRDFVRIATDSQLQSEWRRIQALSTWQTVDVVCCDLVERALTHRGLEPDSWW